MHVWRASFTTVKKALSRTCTNVTIVNRLAEERRISNWDQWYTSKPTGVPDPESKDLITGSFPEHDQLPWKFARVPQVRIGLESIESGKKNLFDLIQNFWKDKQNHVRYFERLQKDLQFTSLDDWYSVSLQDFCASGRNLLNSYYGSSYITALRVRYFLFHLRNLPASFFFPQQLVTPIEGITLCTYFGLGQPVSPR
jgi:hypothetical protein